MKLIKAKQFQHLKHIDTFGMLKFREEYLMRVSGWVLCSETTSAARVWLEFGDKVQEATRFYRMDVINTPDGTAADNQLPGFDVELRSKVPKGILRLFAENDQGEAAEIWSRKVKPKDFEQGNLNETPVFSGYDFLRELILADHEKPETVRDYEAPPVVDCIIPDFGIGAGGHAAIFRILKACEDEGWATRIWIMFSSQHGSPEQIRKVLKEHFQPLSGEIRFATPTSIRKMNGEIGIATDRWTAYFLRAASAVTRKYYLVQDFEPLFYGEGTASLLAENTYRFPFIPFASTPWLAEKLAEFGHHGVTVFRYGVNREFFYPPANHPQNPVPRIAFYSRASTERRAVDLGFIAFELLAKRGVKFEVDFFGYDMTGFRTTYPHRNHGVLNEKGLGDLFRSVDLGVAFSATNPSIISGEMMACGLAVVELDRRNNRASWPAEAMAWVSPDPGEIANRLEVLLLNEQERRPIAEAGKAFSDGLSWEESAAKVVAKLKEDRKIVG
ncbi:MAG: hypothetical protein ACFCU4_06685 [Puniceicoccaceae bacterium]